MSLELYLINHLLLSKETYLKHKVTTDDFFSDRSSIYYKIYQVIDYEYKSTDEIQNLELSFLKAFPGLGTKERESYAQVFSRLKQKEDSPEVIFINREEIDKSGSAYIPQ